MENFVFSLQSFYDLLTDHEVTAFSIKFFEIIFIEHILIVKQCNERWKLLHGT